MELFLAFEDEELERRWVRRHRRGLLRRLQARSAAVCSAAWTGLFLSALRRGARGWRFAAFSALQSAEVATAWAMAAGLGGDWTAWQDGVAILSRVALTPLAHYLQRDWLPALFEGGDTIGAAACVVMTFGGWAAFKGALLFPLKFRHHLAAQVVVALALGLCNWKLCEGCCATEWQASVVGAACSALALLSTGVMIDCTAAGLRRACLTAGLQIPTLFGLVASSALIYRMEASSRAAFLEEVNEEGADGGAEGEGEGARGTGRSQ